MTAAKIPAKRRSGRPRKYRPGALLRTVNDLRAATRAGRMIWYQPDNKRARALSAAFVDNMPNDQVRWDITCGRFRLAEVSDRYAAWLRAELAELDR